VIRKIFVPILTYPDAHAMDFAINASAIASTFNAEMDVLVQGVTFPQLSNAFGTALTDIPALVSEAKALSSSHRKQMEAVLAREAKTAGFELTVSALDTYPTLFPEAAAREARYSDLSVLGVRAGVASMAQLAEAVIFGSGRPALLLPEHRALGKIERISIAWDGTAVAARAISDAQPFLAQADTINIVTVVDDKPVNSADISGKLTRYLKSHGRSAHSQLIQREGRPISECLQDYALEQRAGLLVAGAFGHSRVRDFILGGATKGILESPKLPILLSH